MLSLLMLPFNQHHRHNNISRRQQWQRRHYSKVNAAMFNSSFDAGVHVDVYDDTIVYYRRCRKKDVMN